MYANWADVMLTTGVYVSLGVVISKCETNNASPEHNMNRFHVANHRDRNLNSNAIISVLRSSVATILQYMSLHIKIIVADAEYSEFSKHLLCDNLFQLQISICRRVA